MTSYADVGALAMWDKETIVLEIGVEVLELIADSYAHHGPITGDLDVLQNHHVLVGICEVDLDVFAASGRSTAVLVAATLHCDSDFVVSCPVDGGNDIVVVFGLDDVLRIHVMILLMTRGSILLVEIVIVFFLELGALAGVCHPLETIDVNQVGHFCFLKVSDE